MTCTTTMRRPAITSILCLSLLNLAAPVHPETAEDARVDFDEMATPVDKIKAPQGFQVELIYSVPKESQGSWVNMCVDPRGRLIVSDQYGALYRVTVPAPGAPGKLVVETIPIQLGQAQGLLWAFDCLYVVVNSDDDIPKNGLYRARDTDGDDQLDSFALLRELEGIGEHGPHAVLAAPDGKSLYVVCGNATKITELAHSRVPQVWDDDQLLPRVNCPGGDFPARLPAGCIYQTDPEGQQWDLVSSGFRNQYDAAVNADGELFTFDADAEQEIGTPWYRPTRVCHVVSGADWGWRRDSGKWPATHPDTLPPVIDVGLGSPTGIAFGYGAKFPARYQQALYLCDWTYGRMYAVQMEPRGASYSGTLEEFISGSPLPLTDVVVNPYDGAMYFLIGGRGIQSGLYRVTYMGGELTVAAAASGKSEERYERRALEDLHRGNHADAVERAWPFLNDHDRFIRHAARVALEHCPLEAWQEKALSEAAPQSSLTALLALVRTVPRPRDAESSDPEPDLPAYPAKLEPHPLQPRVLAALERLDWSALSKAQKLELLRVYALAFHRLGPPDEKFRQEIIDRFDAIYPTGDREENVKLTELMCYMQAPSAAAKGVDLLKHAKTQEGQIDIARSLRFLEAGWTALLRRQFLEWFRQALSYKGGISYTTFVKEIRSDALERIPEDERVALEDVIDASLPTQATPLSAAPRSLVKEWQLADLAPLMETKLQNRNFERGRDMFAAANCFSCHRFANEGGAIGPDLTSLAARFSPRDILESVIEPDKVISDQYAAAVFQTTSGKTVIGRIVNFSGDEIYVNTSMLDPNIEGSVRISRDEIEEISPSNVSMMPTGLLNTLQEDEILDLMAYLLSRGDSGDTRFAK